MSAPRNLSPEYLTVEETRTRLGISRSGLYRLFAAGKLVPVHPTPRATRVRRVDVERYERDLRLEADRQRRAC